MPEVSAHKRTVEMFSVVRENGIMDTQIMELTRDEAIKVLDDLGIALGMRVLKESDCGSTMAHEAHLNGGRVPQTWCSGRTRDMT
jgi:hypothetical protein